MAILATQPVTGLYVLGAVGFEIARFPLFLAKYLVAYGRQHPEWTLQQSLSLHVLFSALKHMAVVQKATPLPLTPGAEKERFVTMKPGKIEAYTGPLQSNADVKPAEIGATWYPAPLTKDSDKSNVRVVMHIHGGAFVIGDGRTNASGYLASRFLKHTPATHVVCPQYRLSTLPASKTSNPFPAALQDSLTTYLFLINDLGISPKDIIISGDSAGGNLVISLLRYFEEYGPDLGIPKPSAALLWSPWIDPSDTSASYVYDNDHYVSDYLSPPFTSWGTQAYAGLAGEPTLSQPYISHRNRTFKTTVPLFVNVGGAEILYYEVVKWSGIMKAAGNSVTLDEEKYAPHDIVPLGNLIGFATEATNCAKRVGEWLREVHK